ncbi:unnamed protein product [Parascedosporium putredinis]|uniref:Chromo domain-containing protein n=1 Tax=Parascedosporium putredinis TaxID=1442378 RepID=A0A9P1H6A7_9PEZI|nr:unnamed protein product [Parascedosporium putredinis]CAI7997448.1 unnamed protein product [Parascedosporium putredinis]
MGTRPGPVGIYALYHLTFLPFRFRGYRVKSRLTFQLLAFIVQLQRLRRSSYLKSSIASLLLVRSTNNEETPATTQPLEPSHAMDKWVVRTARPPKNPAVEEILPSSSPRSSSPAQRPRRAPATYTLEEPTLLPPDDSTAYIIDQEMQARPGVASDGKMFPLCRGYWIGWRDLAGASIFVPADRVLDYVSPYTLEQFEYVQWKALREERRAEEEEERYLNLNGNGPAQTTKAAGVPKVLATGGGKGGARRPGRPPKHGPGPSRKEAEAIPVDDAAIEEEIRKRSKDQPREVGPSLSTPQKPRMLALAASAAAASGESEDAALYKQLYGETPSEASLYESEDEPRGSAFGAPRLSRAHLPGGVRPALMSHLRLRRNLPVLLRRLLLGNPTTSATPSGRHRASAKATPSTSRKRRADQRTTPPSAPTSKPQHSPAKSTQPASTVYAEPPPEPSDVQYEVKRIEGVEDFVVNGRVVPYYLVRWEGDWPPEQNPTWEPEENLPPTLVRKFLSKNSTPRAHGGESRNRTPNRSRNQKHGRPPPSAWPERRYSSVTEVFEDPIDIITPAVVAPVVGGTGLADSSEEDSASEDEEMFQVTERPAGGSSSSTREPSGSRSGPFIPRFGIF